MMQENNIHDVEKLRKRVYRSADANGIIVPSVYGLVAWTAQASCRQHGRPGMKILALDPGKSRSVACISDSEMGEQKFTMP